MRYRIEYAGKRHCDFANSRPELLMGVSRLSYRA